MKKAFQLLRSRSGKNGVFFSVIIATGVCILMLSMEYFRTVGGPPFCFKFFLVLTSSTVGYFFGGIVLCATVNTLVKEERAKFLSH